MVGGATSPQFRRDPLPFTGMRHASELATWRRAMQQVFCDTTDVVVGVIECPDQLLIRIQSSFAAPFHVACEQVERISA